MFDVTLFLGMYNLGLGGCVLQKQLFWASPEKSHFVATVALKIIRLNTTQTELSLPSPGQSRFWQFITIRHLADTFNLQGVAHVTRKSLGFRGLRLGVFFTEQSQADGVQCV